MKRVPWLRSLFLILFLASVVSAQDAPLPKQYDLRKVNGVTPIKLQQGGTCWAHGTCAAIESNLLVSGTWKKLGAKDLPSLSEYHLDWWNGFNRHKNNDLDDVAKSPTGLTVHNGGDYRVSAAYITRGDGIVCAPMKPDNSADTTSWYKAIPELRHPEYKRFYVRDIEWFTLGDNLENIDVIKRRIMTEGAIGTAYCASGLAPKGFVSKDFVHYQPIGHKAKPNHAVAIVGWDDEKVSADPNQKLPQPGAWLIKNSWGTKRGDQGYYWISYYDKVCCRDAEMGAASFRNVEPMKYHHVYHHDYHGWRGTMKEITKAANIFKATTKQDIQSLSFYTTADNVKYTATIYSKFENGKPTGERAAQTGEFKHTGFHTIDLAKAIRVEKDETFVICVEVSGGGQAIDRTSEIEVLLRQPEPKKLVIQPKKIIIQPKPDVNQPKKEPPPRGPNGGPIVVSKANPGESFYFDGAMWRDLYDHRFDNPTWAVFDRSANFCMKALTVNVN